VNEFKPVRENLLDMLEDIDDRLSKIADNALASDEPSMPDAGDQSMEAANKQESMRSEINDIKRAISQIDSGTYGICLSCGQAIKRDNSISPPFSNYCQHCTDNKK